MFSELNVSRFWDRVDVRGVDECWPWLLSTDSDGYGTFCPSKDLEGRTRTAAHRYVLALKLGRPLTSDEHSLHTCDFPRCCNPQHIFLGDHLINMRDKTRKRRCFYPKGETNPNAVLSDCDVIEIREMHRAGWSLGQLARFFGVSKAHISRIVKNRQRVLHDP